MKMLPQGAVEGQGFAKPLAAFDNVSPITLLHRCGFGKKERRMR